MSLNARFPLLDGLRGAAVLCVLAEHFGGYPAKFAGFGYYGVDLFFVLSGFLITVILLRSACGSFKGDLWRFVGRRSLRIFPPYYIALVFFLLADYEDSRSHWLTLATYTFNYDCFEGGPFWLWSLAVEEQFYLVWPVLVLLSRKHPQVLAVLTLVLCSASYCQLIYNVVPSISQYNYTGLPNRMGSLCVGALGAVWLRSGWLRMRMLESRVVEVVAIGIVVWGLLALRGTFFRLSSFQFPLIALGSLILILKCATDQINLRWLKKMLGSHLMTELGTVSYAIYLFHPPVGGLLRNLVLGPIWHQLPFESLGPLSQLRWHSWVVTFPICVVSSYGVAKLSWLLFERHILALKDRLFPVS